MAAKGNTKSELRELPLTDLRPSKDQPRRRFDEAGLQELADSIRQMGVLEPILVAHVRNSTYEILAGERRWRAAKIAGLATIPALVVDFPAEKRALVPLVENLIREDLPPLDAARALQRLLEATGLKAAALARRLGMDPRTAQRYLALLKLPSEVQEMVESGALGASQAFELEPLRDDPERVEELARVAARYGLPARKLGRLARRVEQEKARATFSVAAQSANGERADFDEDADPDLRLKKSREEILGEALVAAGTLEWSEAVKTFDTQVCHGACGQWRYPDICRACPGLAFVQMLTKRVQPAGAAR